MSILRSCALLLLSFVTISGSLYASSKVTNENSGVEYTDLQTAINAASPGDTLEVKGRFIGSFSINKNLNLIGKHHATLDGANATQVLTVSTPPLAALPITVTLDHIIIQNGLSLTNGAGILVPDANLVLKHCEVIHNSALGSGAGIFLGTIPVTDLGQPAGLTASLTLINSKVANNQAGLAGGGIANFLGALEIVHSEISRNQAQATGGGIFSFEGINTITHSKIKENAAFLQGGGLANTFDSLTTLKNTKVKENLSGTGGGVYNGAGILGIAPLGSTLIVLNSKIHNNSALADGGGLFNDSLSTATFNNSEVRRNLADVIGGGIFNNTNGALNIDEETEVEKNQPDNIFNA